MSSILRLPHVSRPAPPGRHHFVPIQYSADMKHRPAALTSFIIARTCTTSGERQQRDVLQPAKPLRAVSGFADAADSVSAASISLLDSGRPAAPPIAWPLM